MSYSEDTYWRTADGRGVKVSEMKLGHLVNVINWIMDNPNSYPGHTLARMIAEADSRKTLLFASGEPYPQKMGKRWKIIDPKTGVGTIEKPPADYIEAVKDNPGYQAMSKRTQGKRKEKQ
jgi:hypothetical protein